MKNIMLLKTSSLRPGQKAGYSFAMSCIYPERPPKTVADLFQFNSLPLLHPSLFTGFSPYLRVSLEVILLSRLLVARVLAWGSGLASCDGVGEPGGTWEGVLRSRICPPWKVLLTVEPRDRREEGVEDEEETPEAPAMLWVEGEAGGRRWDRELEETGDKRMIQ